MKERRLPPDDRVPNHSIDLRRVPKRAERDALAGVLDLWNDRKIGRAEPVTSLAVLIRDTAGQITGGLWADTYWDWMFVSMLIVPEPLRRHGVGSDLLAQAEAEARRRGCIGAWLDTFSFQARPFYERHGYRLLAELADYPAPHSRYFMSKRL